MRKLLTALSILLLTAGIVFAWTGSDPIVEITYPDAVADNSSVAIPFTPRGRCYNSINEMDYYELYLVEDTDTDTIIDQAEYDAKVKVIKQEDYNFNYSNANLTPRYKIDSSYCTDGNKYFLVLYGMDINGDPSATLVDLVGQGPEGGSGGWIDREIAYFTASGVR